MAEFRTYVCDVCGAQNATHLEIPAVDYEDDIAGPRESVNGAIDLCKDHVYLLVEVFFGHVKTTQTQRHTIWKQLLNAGVSKTK